MMPLEPLTLSFGAVFLLGLGFGSGPCNVACLPYLGPIFASTGEGVSKAWRILLPFSLGRMVGYALLGGLAGWFGLLVQDWVASPWVRWVLGGGTIVVALALLLRRKDRSEKCDRHQPPNTHIAIDQLNKPEPLLPGGLFLMGMGLALNPCAPLTTVILAAATTGSAYAGVTLGVGFGLGAVLVPAVIFAFGVAHFGQQLKLHLRRWGNTLENASIALLVLMGGGTAMGWIIP